MPLPTPTRLPSRVDSRSLEKYIQPGEPVIVLKATNVGSTAPFEIQDFHGTRSYVMQWDMRVGGHVIRIPFSLWANNKHQLAHELLDQRLIFPLIPLVEWTPPVVPESQPETEETEEVVTGGSSTAAGGDTKSTLSAEDAQKLREAIAGCVADGAKRIKAVCHELTASEEDVRAALADPLSVIEIAQAGWVRLKKKEEG